MEAEQAAVADLELAPLPPDPGQGERVPEDLSLVLDVPLELTVELGRARMTVREALGIAPGTIIALDRAAGEPVDLLVNGHRLARGEVVAIDEEFALRVTELVPPERGAPA